MIKGKYVALALLLTLMVPTAKSQQAFVTNDPVAFGMGNTGVVGKASGYSIYNNSAATAFSQNKGAMAFSYLGWSPSGADAKVPSLSGYYQVGQRMTVLLGTQYSAFSKQPYIDHNDQLKNYRPHNFSLNLGVAYQFVEHLAGAVNVRLLNSKFYGTGATAIGFDLQAMYQEEDISVGLAIKNIGSKFDYGLHKVKQPTQIETGVNYDILGDESLHGLEAAVKLGYIMAPKDSRTVLAAVGLEYSFAGLACARVGYSYGNKNKTLPSFVTVGAGFNLANIHLNGGYMIGVTKHSPIKNSFVIGLAYTIF